MADTHSSSEGWKFQLNHSTLGNDNWGHFGVVSIFHKLDSYFRIKLVTKEFNLAGVAYEFEIVN